MNRRKFDHFEIFKVVFTIVYISSGLLMFGALISNAAQELQQETEVVEQEWIDCMNCDEID